MAEAYFGRGWMNDKQNRADEAIADYSQALKLDPSQTASRNNRGTKYLDAKKYDEALTDFEIILKDEPTQKYALSNKAEALRRKGQLSEALTTVKKALDIDAEFKWARTVEAKVLADMKKQEGGDTSSKKASAAGADDPPSASSKEVVALRERAGSHLANKDYDSAIADFTDIIRRGSATSEDYNQRGLSYHYKNQLDLALADYDRAIARSGHTEFMHYNRALIYRQKGDIEKALADLDAAIDQHGSTNTYHFLERANVLLEKSLFGKAIADYDKLIDILTKDKSATKESKAVAFFGRGWVKELQVVADQSKCDSYIPPDPGCKAPTAFMIPLLDFEVALQMKPDYAEAHFHIGWIAERFGNKRKAIDSYTYALKANPNYSMAYNNRGVIYGNMEQRDLALGDYNDAIRTDPKNKTAWANRGMLLAGMRRRRKDAIADFRQALAIDPSYDYAIKALRKLGVRP
jgi:tetratricopeptide (TPR) repeat protein